LNAKTLEEKELNMHRGFLQGTIRYWASSNGYLAGLIAVGAAWAATRAVGFVLSAVRYRTIARRF
jgi:hypothetical protein